MPGQNLGKIGRVGDRREIVGRTDDERDEVGLRLRINMELGAFSRRIAPQVDVAMRSRWFGGTGVLCSRT
ncbi:hypothetical protein [Oricola cellulosilytica]|uniref:Uncharacterized protein n=1 Tax=Oricola cellulosilytica TaxID=1429082 RepID=A0A4V6N6A5_9HYPH|nr:hypothetical protein [Oricola cellulosilytica]TCD13329.1 hypothetical protein E0D97_12600 [Oricola cellulosilytica]